MTGEVHARQMAQKMLQRAAKDANSARLAKVAASLQAENPFATVLEEIDKMIEIIGEEGAKDKENYDWCKTERKENKAELSKKKKQITGLEGDIDKLIKTIEHPKTGLKAQIAETEQALVDNEASQKKETASGSRKT